jgi:cyclic-di-AMP phosphodiesterase PgpH
VSLARHGLASPVVHDLEVLAGERERGIVVRDVRAGLAQAERVVADLDLVRDLAQARAEVEAAGAGMPRAVPARLRAALTRLAISLVRPTLTLNQAETQRRQREAAERVKPVVLALKRGERIISDGERIGARHLVVFKGIRAQTRPMERTSTRLGGGALIAMMVLLLWRHARGGTPRFRPSRKDAVLLAVLFVATLGLATGGLWVGDALHDRFPAFSPESLYYLVPFAAGAMVARSVLGAEAALLLSMAAGVAVSLAAGHSVFFGLFAALTSVAASVLTAGTRGRRGFFRAGAAVGALGSLLVLATYLFTGRGPADLGGAGLSNVPDMAAAALGAFLGGAVLLPLAVLVLLPLLEGLFGYVTDVKLLALANLNHPALKELIVQAPGTYHHSIVMGALVEAAADAIGANALLARVGAYYHDIGKIRNPLSFAENQRGENQHESLAPAASALIVKRHVADGLELAAHWKLPRPVADVVQQHHGTRQVSFFWAKARKAAEGRAGLPDDERGAGAEDEAYRYPGPKPQSREAALVMIADTCEASSRALPDPSGERLGALVQRRINEIFTEGQLDECDLTLKDLNAIAAAMVRALEAVYHQRPDYPGRAPPSDERPPGVHLVARP